MNYFINIYEKTEEFKSIAIVDGLYLNFLYTLVILFPLLLLTGPFLPDLTMVICALSFLYIILKHKIYY